MLACNHSCGAAAFEYSIVINGSAGDLVIPEKSNWQKWDLFNRFYGMSPDTERFNILFIKGIMAYLKSEDIKSRCIELFFAGNIEYPLPEILHHFLGKV